jgi:exodeoxyribonuclease VII small subunit
MKKKNNTDATTPFSYDAAMTELQNLVASLQNESVSVDDLAENVARAAMLIRLCREKLRQTEMEIQNVLTVE